MDNLKKILETFDKKDLKILEEQIKKSSKTDKKEKLFNMLLSKPNINDHGASLELYNKKSNNINKLKERLLFDIESVIPSQYMREKERPYFLQTEYESILLLMHAHYYIRNELITEAHRKLKRMKELICPKSSALIKVLYHKLLCEYMEKTGDNALSTQLNLMNLALDELRCINEIKEQDLKGDGICEKKFRLILSHDQHGVLVKIIAIVSRLKAFIKNRDIIAAKLLCTSMNTLVESNQTVIDPDLYAEFLLLKAQINLLQYNYQQNIDIIEKIEHINIVSKPLCKQLVTIKLASWFMLQQYDTCQKIIFNVCKCIPQASKRYNMNNLCKYFELCILFAQKKYSQVLRMISTVTTTINGDANISINVKLIEIYTLLIMGKNELLPSRVNSFNAYILKTDVANKERYLFISKLLKQFAKEEDFASCSIQNNFTIAVAPDILGQELISFESVFSQCEHLPLAQ